MPSANKPKFTDRKLAVILFADIVGYTALMQEGEDRAMSILNRYQEVTKKKVQEYRGEIIKTYGDGSLILFDSTVDAVQCAHDLQLAFKTEPKVPLRIGVHLGEIVRKDKDVFGNGVNIASRIESIGVAGAVLMSADVHKRINNQEGFKTQTLGSFDFKNVEESIEVFALANDGITVPLREELEGKLKKPIKKRNSTTNWKKWVAFGVLILAIVVVVTNFISNGKSAEAISKTNSLAIFPFNIQGSPNIQYLGEGMTDLISTKMGGMGSVRVVDPNAILGYLRKEGRIPRDPGSAKVVAASFNASKFIIGSVTELAGQLQFTVRVYDSDGLLLNDALEITGNEEDLPDIVDALVFKLVKEILEKDGTETMKAGAIGTESIQALKSFLQAEQLKRKLKFVEAIDGYKEALEYDPTFALASYRMIITNSWVPNLAIDAKWQDTLAKYQNDMPVKQIKLYKANMLFKSRKVKEAFDAYEKIYQEFPYDIDAISWLGEAHYHLNYRRALPDTLAKKFFEEALSYDAQNPELVVHLVNIYEQTGEFDKMNDAYERLAFLQSDNPLYSGTAILNTTDSLKKSQMISDARKLGNNALGVLMYSKTNENFYEALNLTKDIMPKSKNINTVSPTAVFDLLVSGKFDQAKKYFTNPLFVAIALSITGNLEFPVYDNEWQDLRKNLSGSLPLFEQFPFTCKLDYYESQCVLSMLGGEQDTLQYYHDIINSFEDEAGYTEYVRYFNHKLNALRAYRNGDDELALQYIDTAMMLGFPPEIQSASVSDVPHLRFIKATILFKQGKYVESLQWLENFISGPTSFAFIPLCYLKRAQIYEALENNEKAIVYYDKFLEMYRDCDESLQHHVGLAMERRAELFKQTL